MRKKTIWLPVMLMLALGLAVADKEVREFEVGGAPELRLNNVAGDITVQPGDVDRVVVKYTREDERVEVIFSQNGDTIEVRTEYPRNIRNSGGVDFEVLFPAEGELNIESVSGSIDVEQITGDHRLKSVSGDVKVTDLSGRLRLNSVSGDVVMAGLGSSEVDAATISGDVTYRRGGLLGGEYSFSSTSGDVDVSHDSGAAFEVSGRTVSGNIDNAAGGDIEIIKNKYSPQKSIRGSFNGGGTSLRMNTVSGSLRLREE